MHFENAQIGKGVLKFRKFQKNLCESVPFYLTLQPCSPEFLTSANAGSKKNVSFEYSEIVGSLPEKGLYWSHLINWTLLKKVSSYIFERTLEILGNYQKNVFNSVPFKNLSCPIHPSLCRKLIPPQVFPLFVLRNFRIAGKESVVESYFSQVRQTSTLCNSVKKNLTRAWYVPKIDFSRNFEKSSFNWSCRFTVFSL